MLLPDLNNTTVGPFAKRIKFKRNKAFLLLEEQKSSKIKRWTLMVKVSKSHRQKGLIGRGADRS